MFNLKITFDDSVQVIEDNNNYITTVSYSSEGINHDYSIQLSNDTANFMELENIWSEIKDIDLVNANLIEIFYNNNLIKSFSGNKVINFNFSSTFSSENTISSIIFQLNGAI